ncbi:MAG: zf-HC2 domain-containing protein [Gaiellaceae bacterium]|jgi:anti-sigma factor (TIGR02949 family)
MSETPCRKCEQLLQLYLDGELSHAEAKEAEAHLDACGYCRRHYSFERLFRAYLREAANEPMPAELKAKLASFRLDAGRSPAADS